MVLPPSKRQKAQKPHSRAVFLLLKCFIFFRVQDVFLLEKNSSLFFKIFPTRGPTGFFDSLRQQLTGLLPFAYLLFFTALIMALIFGGVPYSSTPTR